MKLILIILLSTLSLNLGDSISLKLVKCDVNDAYIFSNYSCFAKNFNRYVSTVNIQVFFKKPIYEVYVSFLNWIQVKRGFLRRIYVVSFVLIGCSVTCVQIWNNLSWSYSHSSHWVLQACKCNCKRQSLGECGD